MGNSTIWNNSEFVWFASVHGRMWQIAQYRTARGDLVHMVYRGGKKYMRIQGTLDQTIERVMEEITLEEVLAQADRDSEGKVYYIVD